MIQKQKKEGFRKLVKRLLSQNSHLYPYLQYLGETKEEKIIRLVKDKSTQLPTQKTSISEYLSLILFPKFRVFNPISNLSLLWFLFVFGAIMYYIVEIGLVLTYWQPAWDAEIHSVGVQIADALTVFIFILDIPMSLNCGYLFRGMIVRERKRIVARYLRKSFIIDIVWIIIIMICPLSEVIWLNWFKLWIVFKLMRLWEIDAYYMRKLNIYRVAKAFYVIFKMIILIFILSHIVGLWFYAMDYYFLSSGYYSPDGKS